jgi:hypothetical protein
MEAAIGKGMRGTDQAGILLHGRGFPETRQKAHYDRGGIKRVLLPAQKNRTGAEVSPEGGIVKMTRLQFFIESAKFEVWAYEEAGIYIACFTFWRSPENQLIEFNAGRSGVKFGKHQTWQAKDYMVIVDTDRDFIVSKDEIRWGFDLKNPKDSYVILGTEWEKRGGTWGGRWKSPVDPFHFEG